MIEKVKMFCWLFGHTLTQYWHMAAGGLNGIRNEWFSPDQRTREGESGVMARLFFWLLSGMLMCPKCFRPTCPGKGLSGLSWSSELWRYEGVLVVYWWFIIVLIVSLFNRSELDCSCPWPWPSRRRGALPSFILPANHQNSTVPCLVGDCSKTYN